MQPSPKAMRMHWQSSYQRLCYHVGSSQNPFSAYCLCCSCNSLMCCESHVCPILFEQLSVLCILVRLLGNGFMTWHYLAIVGVAGVGNIEIFLYMLSTVMYKITYTPTFCKGAFIAKQPSCAMCQIGKKEHDNWWTPHFVFKCAPPVWNQCKFCGFATGATLSCGMTLAVFCMMGVHQDISK